MNKIDIQLLAASMATSSQVTQWKDIIELTKKLEEMFTETIEAEGKPPDKDNVYPIN